MIIEDLKLAILAIAQTDPGDALLISLCGARDCAIAGFLSSIAFYTKERAN